MVGDWALGWNVARRRSDLSARRLRVESSALRDSDSCKDFASRAASWAGELAEDAAGEPLVCGAGSGMGAGGGGFGDADMVVGNVVAAA